MQRCRSRCAGWPLRRRSEETLEPAARILGAAEAIDEQIEYTMAPYERLALANAVASVVDRVDEPEIAAAWAAGRAMNEADAAAYALATVAKQTRQV